MLLFPQMPLIKDPGEMGSGIRSTLINKNIPLPPFVFFLGGGGKISQKNGVHLVWIVHRVYQDSG